MAIPKRPEALGIARLEARHKYIARVAPPFGSEGIDKIVLQHKTVPESDPVEIGQRSIGRRVQLRVFALAPKIVASVWEIPHAGMPGFGQRGKITIDRPVMLEAAHGPNPFIFIARTLVP